MEAKIIKVTDKGQISLPIAIRHSLKINQGDSLLLTSSKDSLVLKKIKEEDFSDFLKASESSARDLWDNEEDEAWNNV